MFRTHTCGELRLSHNNQTVTLAGWVQRVRDKGAMMWIDLRDRYGITQIILNEHAAEELKSAARTLGREFVIQVTGTVIEREAKNPKMPTGEIEILLSQLNILNASEIPPFTIEDETDGGEELRMKYRYLDLRRNPLKNNLLLRHQLLQTTRRFMDEMEFLEIETPYLIKSTPEGARDFVVPSRMHEKQFYALPQSPQTFKQILMVGGYDKYFQIVRCFRDEDLRADRQPEFTQLDCEMAFVHQEDILNTFEGLTRRLFHDVKGVTLESFPRMTFADAWKFYGNDKPDTRFDLRIHDVDSLVKGHGFPIFEEAESVVAICATGANSYTRKQIDELTEWVKRPQIGMKGLVYVRYNEDGTLKSSVDKFYSEEVLKTWADATGAQPGDLLLLLSGNASPVRKAMSELRLEMGNRLGLRNPNHYQPLWVIDFPLLEWDEESGRYHAIHHPFTSPKAEDLELLETDPGKVRANAYDLVINGVEIGGGSIRIHDAAFQSKMFALLGFTPEQAQAQFGFLLGAFQYGAPPHGGIALGFDRLCAMFGGTDSIRDYIAFPKNNSGRDMMIDAPSLIDDAQRKELGL
jgi:aspartyl-tRNA synthetase